MAPKYKLTYFNMTGLAEPVRYLLSYGNLKFEDKRVEFEDWPALKSLLFEDGDYTLEDYREEHEEWLKLKPSIPFGQLPILEIDDKIASQTTAICRYLARQLGIAGRNDWEALEADSVAEVLMDLRVYYNGWFLAADASGKARVLDEIRTKHNPFYLSRLEQQAKKNGGHFVNGQLTWADLFFAAFTDLMSNVLQEQILDPYPTLKLLKEKIDALPGIKEHRVQRPKTL